MKKNKSLENYYESMRRLSGIKDNTSYNNSNTTLIEHAKTNDGTVLGIVKDAHHYYIKKTTSKDIVLNESHFTFINGLENKNDYKYNSLGDAQKQLNLVIKDINETFSKDQKISKSKNIVLNEDKSTKVEKPFEFLNKLIKEGKNEKQLDNFNRFKKSMNVNEDVEDEESVENSMDSAMDTLDDLDDKIKSEPKEKEEVEQDFEEGGDSEEELDLSDIDVDNSDEKEEVPADDETEEGDDIDIDDLDLGDDEETKEDTSDEGDSDDDLNLKEVEKLVGKLTYKIRSLDLTPDKTKSFMNSILASFESDLSDVDLEDKKEMSNTILKAEKEDDEEISEDVMEDKDNQTCEGCKTFESYLSDRGYDDTSDVTSMEMANVISDYIDDNEGDLDDETLTEIAKHCNDDVINELKEYGHLDECDKLQPFIKNINEEGVDFGTVEANVDNMEIKEDAEIELVDDEDDNIDTSFEIEDTPEVDFSPAADTLGVSTGSRAKLDVNLKTGDAIISLEEQKENKIRKYIRKRIEEKFNGKKGSLNESKKSAKIKKLDEMIDKTLLKLTK